MKFNLPLGLFGRGSFGMRREARFGAYGFPNRTFSGDRRSDPRRLDDRRGRQDRGHEQRGAGCEVQHAVRFPPAEWSDELSDARQDIYTLDDGKPVDASG